ncbi:hypothetical protein Cgig2_031101 [Carnegiea gigantea]|uniref:Uncharacterized protein n=1 Tax=Carnegiea gigantea TaxID=171969 RepID=A0A9Q1JI86_9CARY|nr:hypothetical protein Cgig2_031101 [Carnegiea gigantea]
MTSKSEASQEITRERGKERGKHTPFIMAFPPLHDTSEMTDFVRESFTWHWRRATCLPCPLLDDYQDLCPRFSLPEAERAALDFELPEMVQATFYAMLLNDAVELGIVSGFLTDDLKSSLEGLRWTSFEAWLSHTSHDLREAQLRQQTLPSEVHGKLPMDYHGLCPRFDLGMATRYAYGSNILKMVQAIFCAMVVEDAAKLGLSCRLTMDCMMWAMRKASAPNLSFSWRCSLLTAYIPEMVQDIFYVMVINEVAKLGLSSRDAMGHMMRDLLKDTQAPRLVEMVYNPQPRPEVTLRPRGAPSVSSDEE